jgi:hypothetical protein
MIDIIWRPWFLWKQFKNRLAHLMPHQTYPKGMAGVAVLQQIRSIALRPDNPSKGVTNMHIMEGFLPVKHAIGWSVNGDVKRISRLGILLNGDTASPCSALIAKSA